MKWLYLAAWIWFVVRDVPALWRSGEWRALTVWLLLSGAGLGMALVYFEGGG